MLFDGWIRRPRRPIGKVLHPGVGLREYGGGAPTSAPRDAGCEFPVERWLEIHVKLTDAKIKLDLAVWAGVAALKI